MSATETAHSELSERKPLTGFERFIQVVAFVAAGLGLLAMAGYLVLLGMKGYRIGSDVDTQVTAQVGDFIGGVAGALFALAATLLFYLALTLQRREFQNSLRELRISSNALSATEKHHEHTLTVMREEKEFNVCMAAIKDLEEDWGKRAGTELKWKRVQDDWLNRFPENAELHLKGIAMRYPIDKKAKFNFEAYQQIMDMVQRAGWVVDSISSKTLSVDDRKYLAQMARPTVRDMWSKLDELIRTLNSRLAPLKDIAQPHYGYTFNLEAVNVHFNRLETNLRLPMEQAWRKLSGL